VWKAELTLYNATTNRLIGLPKRNVVECPSSRQLVDITAADLPVLLHELSAQEELAALTCYDCHGDMLQVWCHNRRLAVEWQILPERDFNRHRIWVASRPVRARGRTRLGTVETGLNLFTDEVLSPRDVHRLWIAFLHGNERPNAYHWREVTQELDMPGLPPRHRHTSAADQTRQPCFGSS
jgi:hypothetical protein